VAKKGKKYRAAAEKVERDRNYPPSAAMRLVKETVTTSFDPTIDVAVQLGVDPRRADQMVRGSVTLPHGTGKSVKVAVFAEGAAATAAEEAGADIVGTSTIIEMIEAGDLDFDAVIATPDQMGKIGRYGKVLGPRGLMPNPKSGTVTEDVGKAVRDLKGGLVEYRTDRHGNLHLIIGKKSFSEEDLVANYLTVIEEVIRAKPAAAKGRYLKSVTLAPTMGPGIRIDPTKSKEVSEDLEPAAP
jgi:large subunit ribosomal protein L1